MKDGFIKIAACAPKIRLGDPKYNADLIIDSIKRAANEGVTLIAFPELAITGYTMGDLFEHELLLNCAQEELLRIKKETENLHIISVIGMPIRCCGKLLNCAAVIDTRNPIAFVAKHIIPNYGEFYEARQFKSANDLAHEKELQGTDWPGKIMPPGSVFAVEDIPNLIFGVEICEDMWVTDAPSNQLAKNGALLIVNCSASNELIGKADYRRSLISVQSAKTASAYLYVSAGEGESTSDMVFSGHSMCYENGSLLAENRPFENQGELLITEIDLGKLLYERRRSTSFESNLDCANVYVLNCGYDLTIPAAFPETKLTRRFDRNPFVPKDDREIDARANDILMIQAMGLKRRIEQIGANTAVIGISGGLDSSLALLVCAKACDLMGKDRKTIYAITMPCFGTTARTKSNAIELCEALGATVKTIDITDSVRQHFNDIGHDESNHNVVYENAQARIRTLILMDEANATNGLVVGTGDLSELALGWATYNGDHMSMYAVNAGVPKTLLKYIVRYYANTCGDERVKNVLYGVLNTPISPELLPPDESGNIAQRTEDLVGPYELHDFFLYYVLRWGYPPKKLYRITMKAFKDSEYTEEVIWKWLRNFYRRFFTQQFKRNCLPDGPKVGSVCLSPRGDWRMPSDASYQIWMDEIEAIKPKSVIS